MKKEITASGPNGTFTGLVKVVFNLRSEIKEFYNSITHDEDNRQIIYDAVYGFANLKEVYHQEIRQSDSVAILIHTKFAEEKVISELNKLANENVTPTIQQLLQEKGYQ